MNSFTKTLFDYLGDRNYEKIAKCKVGIAGAGGLGSNCAACLVRSGFKKYKICDFDAVSYANLNRQFFFYDQVGILKVNALKENLLRINPGLDLEASTEKITEKNVEEVFHDCDIVIEAFDLPEYKKLLAEAYMNSGKLYVGASGLAGWGKSEAILINKLRDNLFMVGDMVSEVSEIQPPFAPMVSVAAAKQADIALAWAINCK
jgi:sulfur carrier protein ThiS adenylyltransferase